MFIKGLFLYKFLIMVAASKKLYNRGAENFGIRKSFWHLQTEVHFTASIVFLLGRIYVERISGQDNDRNKIGRVRVNNSDSKYPEGKTRDVYGSKIQPVVSWKAAGQ